MRVLIIIIGSIALLSGEMFWTGAASRVWQRHQYERDNPRAKLEQRMADAGLVLHQMSIDPPETSSVRTTVIPRASLPEGTLYLRDETSDRNFIYADADGYLHKNGAVIRQARREVRLIADNDHLTLLADSAIVAEVPTNRWKAYLSTTEGVRLPTAQDAPRVSIRDGFMREKFIDDNWRIVSGDWNLRQRGGGLPEDEKQAESYNFQRAVNPFSLLGKQNGHVFFGREALPHARIAARVYFGRPKMTDTVDFRALTIDTDALLTIGEENEKQLAFGWHGASATFCLLGGFGPGTWEVVEKYDGPRPPLTNWIKLELQLHRGSRVVALLDNEIIFDHTPEKAFPGVFGIASGNARIEVDDVELDTLPPPAGPAGSPVYVKSKGFAAKKIKNGRDPIQFQQWARGSNTFTRSLKKLDDDRILRAITTRIPVYGDLQYESVPFHEDAGVLESGRWQIALKETTGDGLTTIDAEKTDKGWRIIGLPDGVWPADRREFTLRLSRARANANQPMILAGEEKIPVGSPLQGPLAISIGRWYNVGDRLDPPDPEHHLIRDGNLHHEFFEEAATDWNWIDGGFRMAARWACQAEWNFMACGSPGTSLLSSKRVFNGDQEHDYHMTIRPCTPWDAGDDSWVYSRKAFDRNGGWYSRHNLNFSFCADPQDPLSGYAVIFAGDDNERTMLLKNGQVIASTDNPDFLMSKKSNKLAVHWSWWHFHVRKTGDRIRVDCNDEPLFDVVDPTPLAGGHIGFWTVRNGFVVSRVTSTADDVSYHSQAAYVPTSSTPSTFWRPMLQDALTVSQSSAEKERFTMNSGAGFQAVRHVYPEAIDLSATPNLHMTIEASPSAKVNAHLQIDGQGYLIQFTAPVSDMKRILIPEGEVTSEQFRIRAMSDTNIAKRTLATAATGEVQLDLYSLLKEKKHDGPGKLEAITIGNSSNAQYLLAGGGGNTSGEWYELTVPEFH